jgi:hypothetical protein
MHLHEPSRVMNAFMAGANRTAWGVVAHRSQFRKTKTTRGFYVYAY